MSRMAEYYDFQQMLYLLSTRALEIMPVSYTHLTLPTNREV